MENLRAWPFMVNGQVSLEDLKAWPFIVKGVHTGPSRTSDPVLLKRFWCSSSGNVLILWFCVWWRDWLWMQLEINVLSSEHALAA